MTLEGATIGAHPLDGCDESECYQTMMAERNELIKARRETEDNFVKTIVQLAAALLVLLTGYVVDRKITVEGWVFWATAGALVSLVLSVAFGLFEQYFSSKAYLAQQAMVEAYYQKEISTFTEPPANRYVRRTQISAFICFLITLTLLSAVAVQQIGKDRGEQLPSTSSSSSAASASAPATSSAPAPITAARGASRVRDSSEVGGSEHATTAAEE